MILKKIVLQSNFRDDFLQFAEEKKKKGSYKYINRYVLLNTFQYFLKHKLTVQEDGTIYWFKEDEKVIENYGYVGFSGGIMDDEVTMIQNLFNELYNQAEWIAKSLKSSLDYKDVIIETIQIISMNE
jgi:hypothetical protein